MNTIRTACTLFVSVALSFEAHCQAPALRWSLANAGSQYTPVTALCRDMAGNLITAGYFTGLADLDPGTPAVEKTSAGQEDIYIQKLTPEGELLWAQHIGGPMRDYVHACATDGFNGIYLTGSFEGQLDFDPGAGTQLAGVVGVSSSYVLKLNPDGSFAWIRSWPLMPGMSYSPGSVIADGGNGVYASSAVGSVKLIKLTSAGDSLWAIRAEQAAYEPRTLALGVGGSLIVRGTISGSADVDPGPGVQMLGTSGQYQSCIVKLTPGLGTLHWALLAGGNSFSLSYPLSIDGDGTIYLAGMYTGTYDLDPGPNEVLTTSIGMEDICIQKIDHNGSIVWGRSVGGPYSDVSGPTSVGTDGSLMVAGNIWERMDVDPGPDTVMIGPSSRLSDDIIMLRLSREGQFAWAGTLGNNGADFASTLMQTIDGTLYVAGQLSSSSDFDFSPAVSLLSVQGHNGFLARYDLAALPAATLPGLQQALDVYPNPGSGSCTIQVPAAMQGALLTVCDAKGRELVRYPAAAGQAFCLKLAGPVGLYTFTLSDEAGRRLQARFVKQ